MSTITAAAVAERVARIDAQTDTDARGKAFEELAEFLFNAIGCLTERNLVSPMGAEQVDLAGCHMGVIAPLPPFFLVECKYWEGPLDSAGVGYFINVCANRSVPLGIIISKEGLTGNAADATYAHSLAFGAAARGVHLILLTLDHLQSLKSNDDLVELLRRSWIRAVGTSGFGVV